MKSFIETYFLVIVLIYLLFVHVGLTPLIYMWSGVVFSSFDFEIIKHGVIYAYNSSTHTYTHIYLIIVPILTLINKPFLCLNVISNISYFNSTKVGSEL